MKFSKLIVVKNWKRYKSGSICITDGFFSEKSNDKINIDCNELIAYPSLINCHDHLVGNWLPKTAKNRPYKNTSVWVEDMKTSGSVIERNKFWTGNLSNLMENDGICMAMLGIYKNIFSGVTIVQDHIPVQNDEYYQSFPIEVISQYRQGHSITLGNWWGGMSLEDEMAETHNKIPFVIHLAEGIDDSAKSEFVALERMNLLRQNSLLVHCTAFTKSELKKIKDVDANIAWCPNSNIFLLDTTLDIDTILDLDINISLGTDSTLSGSINLLKELLFTKKLFSQLTPQLLFKMVTENPAKALKLKNYNGKIEIGKDANLLLTKKVTENPYENLLNIESKDIMLLLYRGIPIYGCVDFLKYFSWEAKNYFMFETDEEKMFVIGHPEEILMKIYKALGTQKHFDYIPFS
ncbi:MAG: amidohydrolase family protein [Candidatus Cloacimonetes bacterium]|nr:amidohydrolase family protein [Candidatus Cloacimonadota bacterium]